VAFGAFLIFKRLKKAMKKNRLGIREERRGKKFLRFAQLFKVVCKLKHHEITKNWLRT
jgi:hypothetical protein